MGGTSRGMDLVISEANSRFRRSLGAELRPLIPSHSLNLGTCALSKAEKKKQVDSNSEKACSANTLYILALNDGDSFIPNGSNECIFVLMCLLVAIRLSSDFPIHHAELSSWLTQLLNRYKFSNSLIGGSVDDWLGSLCKKRYLIREKISEDANADPIQDADHTLTITSWAYGIGPRAELEFPEENMCEFCKNVALLAYADSEEENTLSMEDKKEEIIRRISDTFL